MNSQAKRIPKERVRKQPYEDALRGLMQTHDLHPVPGEDITRRQDETVARLRAALKLTDLDCNDPNRTHPAADCTTA